MRYGSEPAGRRAQLEESVALCLAQLDTAGRQEPSEELPAKTAHLKEKLARPESEMQRLAVMQKHSLELRSRSYMRFSKATDAHHLIYLDQPDCVAFQS